MKRYHIKRSYFTQPALNQFKSLIDEQGFLALKFGDVEAKYYNAELAFLLSHVELPMTEHGSRTESPVKTLEFTQSYVNGYIDGVNYFKNTFGVSANVLYGEHAEEFIKSIHLNQYHVRHSNLFYDGWESVKYLYPIVISNSIMQEFGYFAGIISEVEAMKKTHPKIFLKYDKCDEPTSTELNHVQNALRHIYEERELDFPGPIRLRNTYNKLNAPGAEGQKNRRCTGETKRSLTTRLSDLSKIKPLITRSALEKLLLDEAAILKDFKRFEK